MRVYFTVASYWLIDNFTSMTRAAGTAPKYIQYWCTCTYLLAPQISIKKNYQQTEMVTNDLRPPSERSRRDASTGGGSFFVDLLLKMLHSTTPQKMTIQKDPQPRDAPFRELSNGGFRMSVAISVCW